MGKRKHKSIGGSAMSPRIGQHFPLEIPPSPVSKQSGAGLRRRMTGCNRRGHEDDYHPRHLLIQPVLSVITDTNHFPLPCVCLTALVVKYFFMALCIFTRICRGHIYGLAVVWKCGSKTNKKEVLLNSAATLLVQCLKLY